MLLNAYYDAFWFVLISIPCIGYGDYFPRSLLGRLVISISCVCGIFMVSILVNAMMNLLGLSEKESISWLILDRLKQRKSMKSTSEEVVRRVLLLYYKKCHQKKIDHKELFKLNQMILKAKKQRKYFYSFKTLGTTTTLLRS